MEKIRINLQEILLCLSSAQDLLSAHLSNHQQQVAYLSYRLAEHMGLPFSKQKRILLAGLVHDIGAISDEERLAIIEMEPLSVNNHAFKGARLLEEFRPMREEANIIRYHHLPWNNGEGLTYMGHEVPLESHIIHLADRFCTKILPSKNIFSQLPAIVSTIAKGENTVFEPSTVKALMDLSHKEYIWLDLISQFPAKKLTSNVLDILALELDDVVDLATVFSHIIDFRSKFTARHSAGVAKTAQKLAELIGFSPSECKMMLIAGYLHDLGKLAVSNEVLEKPDKLNTDEFNEIRSHTYFTYQLLSAIPQFETINKWASFHHEKLAGDGYPFHIESDHLSLGARIMTVADVSTAITEDRPYRKGMDNNSAIEVLKSMLATKALDENVVQLLIDNFDEINRIREEAQQQASSKYEAFLQVEY